MASLVVPARLDELGIELPPAAAAVAPTSPAVRCGDASTPRSAAI